MWQPEHSGKILSRITGAVHTEEIDLINKKIKFASDIFNVFIDGSIDDNIPFGDVRKKVFSVISREDIHLVSKFFDKNKIDVIEYQ